MEIIGVKGDAFVALYRAARGNWAQLAIANKHAFILCTTKSRFQLVQRFYKPLGDQEVRSSCSCNSD